MLKLIFTIDRGTTSPRAILFNPHNEVKALTQKGGFGAVYAAGLAVGFWQDVNALRRNWQEDTCWEPIMEKDQLQNLYTGWEKTVTRTFDWVNGGC
jgi:glycerol kinase